MNGTFRVRSVRYEDLARLAEIEQKRWGKIPGTPALDVEDLTKWYECNTPYFIVAEDDGGNVVGYNYAVGTEYSFDAGFDDPFKDCDSLRDYGVAPAQVNHSGNAVYSISVTSLHTGAAKILHHATKGMIVDKRIEFILGVSRLSSFKWYRNSLPTQLKSIPKEEVARWYVEETIRLAVNGQPTLNNLKLPALRHADPVITYNVNGTPFFLRRIVHMMPNDVRTMGLGAVLVSQYPHTLQ